MRYMRNRSILIVTALLMAVSCSNDEIMRLQQDNPIEFRTVMNRQTKAVSYSASTLQTFNVTAWKSGADRAAGTPHIDCVDYARTDDGTYKSAIKYYWPASGGLVFYAYAPGVAANNGLVRNSELSYTVTPLDDTDSQIDLVFSKNSGTKSGNGSTGVTLNFRHAMSQIRIKVKNNSQTTRFNVTGWKIAGVDGSATFTFDDAVENTNTEAANSQNTINASMWSGNADSYAASYSKTITSRSVTGSNASWGELDGSAILIPQTAPQATAYSNQVMNGAYIAIRYEAVSSDNNDVLVDTTWGCWPVQFEWAPGFRYNYVIDLSEFGYKEEGTGELDPIMDNAEVKFVTVTVDSWQPEDGDDVNLPLAVAYPSYLRFRAPDGPQALGMVNMMGDATETNIEYSLDEGATWTALNTVMLPGPLTLWHRRLI